MANIQTNNFNSEIIFRLDKNFENNLIALSRLADGNGNLLRNVLYYLADSYQHSITRFGVFDVNDFAQKYSYSISYLQKKHPKFYQWHNLSESDRSEYLTRKARSRNEYEGKYWDSYIENALYILMARSVVFDFVGGAYMCEDSIYKASGGCQVITSLSAIRVGNKLYYQYSLNEEFMRNLSTYYSCINRNHLIALRRYELDVLYVAVQRWKNAVGAADERRTKPGAISFEHLAELSGVPRYTRNGEAISQRERKRQVVKAFSVMKNNTGEKCELLWERLLGDDYDYSPFVVFADEALCGLRPDSLTYTFFRNNAFRSVFKDCIIREMFKAFTITNEKNNSVNRLKLSTKEIEDMFCLWFFSEPLDDSDNTARYVAFCNACKHAFKNYPDGVKSMYSSFRAICANRKGDMTVLQCVERYVNSEEKCNAKFRL